MIKRPAVTAAGTGEEELPRISSSSVVYICHYVVLVVNRDPVYFFKLAQKPLNTAARTADKSE